VLLMTRITEAVRPPVPPPGVFERIAAWSYRRRWWALALWVLVLVAVTGVAQAIGGDYRNDFSLPGTQSQRALDVLRAHVPDEAGAVVQIVLQDGDGLRDPAARQRVETMLASVGELPRVADVRSPYDAAGALSADDTTGYASVNLDAATADVPAADIVRIIDTARAAAGDGLRIELGGEAVVSVEEGGGGPAEGAGLLAALVILVLLFGSIRAASIPIVIALLAVGSAIGLVTLASHVATVADFTTPLMILVGLGVGIDYALLLFSRYRSEFLAGAERAVALGVALNTAGRTIFFAASTVVIALLGLVVLGLGSLQGVAVAVALTVLSTMVGALTLLPALLGIMGPGIEGRLRRRESRRRGVEGDTWRRLSSKIQHRPWAALLLGVIALGTLGAPALGLTLGIADAGNNASSRTSRQAYDLLADGFGPGFNGPLLVVVNGGRADQSTLTRTLSDTPGVAAVTPPRISDDGSTTTVVVFPDSKPQDPRTADLVNRLRSSVLPPLATATGSEILVGGSTAAVTDFSDAVAGRLPLFIGVVVGLSALLLLVVFRSVFVAVKAAVLNLFSVAASMGAITLVFQHGLLHGLLGVEPGPIEAYVPVMIFAIAFGLSMDYEVFLLARMREEWDRHHDPHRAVHAGLATTGRVVSAAAAIMVVVFAAFLLDPGRMLKQFGFGLAVAVLVDALVIRCLMVPALMHLFGERAWWLPRGLARRIPRVSVEKS
jgi:putative drug exporter of the RND superfamily